MMALVLGLGVAMHAGAAGGPGSDSSALALMRSRLPEELRSKVEKARADLQAHRDTLARWTAEERNGWLDSIRKAAKNRRSDALDELSPLERQRIEARLRQLERSRSERSGARTSNPGFRQ